MKLLKRLFAFVLSLAALITAALALLVVLDEQKRGRYVRVDPNSRV